MKKFILYLLCIWIYSGTAQNTAGDSVFNVSTIHQIDLTFSQPSFWDSLTAYYSIDQKMMCKAVINGVTYDSIGAQLKGNSSYNSYPGYKKSFKLDFNNYNSTREWNGLKGVMLNNGFKDPTMMREKIMLDYMNKHGAYAPRATYAKLYINGQYWGFYSLVEEVTSSKFLKDRFSDKKGNLFKGDPQGSLQWFGSAPANYYSKYELKTNETINNWSDLIRLIDKLNNTPSANLFDSLETILNSNSYLLARAGNIVFANLDSYDGSGHNYYIYDDSITNKFNWIVWDVNEAFGNFNMGMTLQQLKDLNIFFVPNPQTNRPLALKTMNDTKYKNNYIQVLCSFVYNDFKNSVLDPYIDSIAARIQSDYFADPNKIYTNQQFTDNITKDITLSGAPGGNQIAGLKPFINARRNNLEIQLAPYGCYLGKNDSAIPSFFIALYPNPANNLLHITVTGDFKIDSYSIYDITGKELLQQAIAKSSFITVPIQNLANGIYLIRINNKHSLTFIKAEKI